MQTYIIAFIISLLLCISAHAKTATLRPSLNWHIQLDGNIKVPKNIDLIEIDFFDTPTSQIANLKSKNIFVLCYFSAGTIESWRPDVSKISKASLGKSLSDWAGETWWNVKNKDVRAIILERLYLAKSKGCDGVDPDNVDFYDNDTGLSITKNDTLIFLKWLATQAHNNDLKIALKNSGALVSILSKTYDLNVTEQCFEYEACEDHLAFIKVGKPILNIEYRKQYINNPKKVCIASNKMKFSTLLLPLDLDGSFRINCHIN